MEGASTGVLSCLSLEVKPVSVLQWHVWVSEPFNSQNYLHVFNKYRDSWNSIPKEALSSNLWRGSQDMVSLKTFRWLLSLLAFESVFYVWAGLQKCCKLLVILHVWQKTEGSLLHRLHRETSGRRKRLSPACEQMNQSIPKGAQNWIKKTKGSDSRNGHYVRLTRIFLLRWNCIRSYW